MKRRTFVWAWAAGALGFVVAPRVVGADEWRGRIDLHQGGTGIVEFTLEGTAVRGKIVVKIGDRLVETPIDGKWQGGVIEFWRRLSETSGQPFQGAVTQLDDRHVKMAGKFAAGFQGDWTSECERVAVSAGKERREVPAGSRLRTGTTGTLIPLARPGVVLDFATEAPSAQWTNAWLVLGFPGEPGNVKGYARLVHQARLEDGKVYPRVLETHPHQQPRGIVTGRYAEVPIPASGAEFVAGVGFLAGADASDGVYFEVRGEFPGYSGIPLRREYFKKYDHAVVADFCQDLSRFQGLRGMIILSVNAGKVSAEQDRAVWVEPRLRSLAEEPKFASFVGGAIGTSRQGGRLVNPWGGKSGGLLGSVVLYLRFANVDRPYPVRIESYRGESFVSARDLGTVDPACQEIWQTLARDVPGEWRERIIFNGTYAGDFRYTVSRGGE